MVSDITPFAIGVLIIWVVNIVTIWIASTKISDLSDEVHRHYFRCDCDIMNELVEKD